MKKSPLNQSNPDYNNEIYYNENDEQDMSEEDVENLDEDRNSEFTQKKNNDMKFERDFKKLQKINQTEPVMINAGKSTSDDFTQTRTGGTRFNAVSPGSGFQMKCWKGYKAKGKKKSPSGKKTSSGKIKMVNNCVKK